VEAKPLKRKIYKTEEEREPFADWMNRLKGSDAYGRILTRLKRAELGNFGDHKSVGAGVIELRIDFGPGYRVYLGRDGDDIILLCGGTKRNQQGDIEIAQEFWRDYNA